MKKILAIESSCDETACAIIDEELNILSSVVTSQIDVHARFGGVIPEVASRMHVEQISTIVDEALKQANEKVEDMDAIAYTMGPGLIGSLHVGGIAAKTLAFFYDKPLIGVHHLKGHIFINELLQPLKYPLMFSVCDLVLISKIDTLDYFDFDIEKAKENIKNLNSNAKIICVSAKSGEGMDEFVDWLKGTINN